MSARDRIIALLRTHPDGLDDDVIAERLGLSRRQQANSRCRELEREGIVERRSVGGKIQNILTGNAPPVHVRAEPVTGPANVDPGRPWCWEGIVARSVTSFLTARGSSIEAIANTETGEPGADIKARRAESVLIVEVTIDPDTPVIDSIVLQNLGVRLPAYGSDGRRSRIVELHGRLLSSLTVFLKTDVGRYLVKRFRATYPEADVTEIKMLDLVLWQTR